MSKIAGVSAITTKNRSGSPGSRADHDKGDKPAASGSRHKSKRNNNRGKRKQPKFEGSADELKGHIFDCIGVDMADLFTKTK